MVDGNAQFRLITGCGLATYAAAGRSTTPRGTSPVVTSCHSAMSSLRASATIIVLRVAPRASAVRARYHCASPLSFWNIRKRQASCSMPRRTRALPALAKPFSRRRTPLSSGEPVSPPPACAGAGCTGHGTAIAQLSREHLLHQHIGGLDPDPDDTRQQQDHRMASLIGLLPQPFGARCLDLADLFVDEA